MPEAKKVLCPECETEVNLSEHEGVCQKCGLDVGQIVEKDRYDTALQKYREKKAKESGAPPKKRRMFS